MRFRLGPVFRRPTGVLFAIRTASSCFTFYFEAMAFVAFMYDWLFSECFDSFPAEALMSFFVVQI